MAHGAGESTTRKTMTTHSPIMRHSPALLAPLFLLLATATPPWLHADCGLSAPGVAAGSQKATTVPFTKEFNLPPCYKFVYSGIEAKGNTNGGGGSGGNGNGSGGGNNGNGNGNDPSQHSSSYNSGYNAGYNNGCARGYDDGYNDGRYSRNSRYRNHDDDDDRYYPWYWGHNSYNRGYYTGYDYGYAPSYDRGYINGCNRNSTGTLNFKCTVSDNRPQPTSKTCSLQFKDVNEFNGSTAKNGVLSPVCVYKATTVPIVIKLTWKCEGSAPKPNGNVTILGEYQKDPPPPTGSLNFPVGDLMLQVQGGTTRPDAQVKIVRE